jgi:2-oxoglutarate dehydrogenase E2 component (dihydrolipoamide succinyltransferase)
MSNFAAHSTNPKKLKYMAQIELVMPKMGESIMEATILKWNKKVGDRVELDETILEIATDKVDSEIPSPVEGTLVKILHQENEVVEIGKTIAIIETEAGAVVADTPAVTAPPVEKAIETPIAEVPFVPQPQEIVKESEAAAEGSGRFYSPLVKNIAKEEGLSLSELDKISGSGQGGRVTKSDILQYIEQKSNVPVATTTHTVHASQASAPAQSQTIQPQTPAAQSMSGDVEIIEMDRMRKLIADHMVKSKHTSPHVTSFVEVDVTEMVNWRNKYKDDFAKKYGEKITFTPFFIEAVAKAILDFPMINISVEGDKIIRKKSINIGMAAALPSGNLIVPVIKQAETLNLVGITKQVNDLANRARANKLKPEEIQGGTFTLTNVGTFGNVMGTPIINQPQVAIMATGAIKKKPAVLETVHGDVIAIRQMMFLSLSYDHRVVDGSLGGSFLRKVADYLEAFDPNRSV